MDCQTPRKALRGTPRPGGGLTGAGATLGPPIGAGPRSGPRDASPVVQVPFGKKIQTVAPVGRLRQYIKPPSKSCIAPSTETMSPVGQPMRSLASGRRAKAFA